MKLPTNPLIDIEVNPPSGALGALVFWPLFTASALLFMVVFAVLVVPGLAILWIWTKAT